MGNDFRDAYVPGTTLTGAGQSIGLVEFETYYPSDITDYEDAIGMSSANRPELVAVQVGQAASIGEAGDDGEECSLDIELSLAMAPGLASIYVFEDGTDSIYNGDFDDIFEAMVNYTNVLQFSCSWGGSTDQDINSEALFKQMATQGQSFYDASGDDGAFVGDIEFPSDSPSITQVGGTTLTDGAAPSYSWNSEVVWAPRHRPQRPPAITRLLGGFKQRWDQHLLPDTGLANKRQHDRKSGIRPPCAIRQMSLPSADNVFAYTDDGQGSTGWGGTSCSAPLWAGLTALMNQQTAASKLPPVGFLNPALYGIAARPDHARFFHDITSGNNAWRDSANQFYATAGYDLCCGIGSINGAIFVSAIVFPGITLVADWEFESCHWCPAGTPLRRGQNGKSMAGILWPAGRPFPTFQRGITPSALARLANGLLLPHKPLTSFPIRQRRRAGLMWSQGR